MVYEIIGGSITIYGGAYVLRWIVKAYAVLSGATLASHNVRYATIWTATLLLVTIGAIAERGVTAPDFSLWAYLVGGVIVFVLSVANSYWRWRRAQNTEPIEPEGLVGVDPWGHRRPRSRPAEDDDGSSVAEVINWGIAVLIGAGVITSLSLGIELETVVAVVFMPVFWLGEGFVTAITNPYYLGGLVIGFGTGWIARGAFVD